LVFLSLVQAALISSGDIVPQPSVKTDPSGEILRSSIRRISLGFSDVLKELYSKLGVNGEDGARICRELAQESPQVAGKRADLLKKLEWLETASARRAALTLYLPSPGSFVTVTVGRPPWSSAGL
jgi:hypothetical protein